MDGKDLIYGMGFVDEKFVEEAEYATQIRRTSFPWKYYFVAACFVCVISVAMLIPSIFDTPVAPPDYEITLPYQASALRKIISWLSSVLIQKLFRNSINRLRRIS